MASLRELIVTYEANSKPLVDALKKADKEIKKLSSSIGKQGKEFNKAGKSMSNAMNRPIERMRAFAQVARASFASVDASIAKTSKNLRNSGNNFINLGKDLAMSVSLPIIAIGATSLKAASDAEEIASKYSVVFKDVEKTATNTANVLAQSFGLSIVKTKELLGSTGDLLTGFGFSSKAALDLSKRTNELAVDLASFTNFSGGAEGASQALTKALLGERESVKSLGISILEQDVKKQVALMTSQGMTFESERQAKAIATLEIAYRQSKNAIGDYARTQKSFANQFRVMKARIFDVQVSLGKMILPSATRALETFIGFLERLNVSFSSLSEGNKKVILVLGGVLAAAAPILVIFGGLVKVLGIALLGFTAILAPFKLLGGALIAGLPLIKAFSAAVFVLSKRLVMLAVANPLTATLLAVSTLILYFDEIKGLLSDVFDWFTKLNASAIFDKFKDIAGGFVGTVKNVLGFDDIDNNPNIAAQQAIQNSVSNNANSVANNKTVNNSLVVNIPAGTRAEDGLSIKNMVKAALQEENRSNYIELGAQ